MNRAPIGKAAVEERYRQSTPGSRQLFDRATRHLPGGNTRTTIYHAPYPWYFGRGSGCWVFDVDGNERLDFINNYTALILGHNHPKVIEAVEWQLARGISAAAPSEAEVELAAILTERLPSIDLLRITNSGTEATMMALRAARAFTGRERVAKFEGGYHGTHDYAAVQVSAAGAVGTGSETQGDGIPAGVASSVVSIPFNDFQAVEDTVGRHRNDLAAVIVEPVVGAGGVIPPAEGFLAFLREITERWGILLIFDEVISFRVSYHGAQGYFGVTPDLTTLGKIIGGGFAVGAFGGRADIMSRFDPRESGYVGHGGTFNALPVTMAAGAAVMRELTPDVYARLETLGDTLKWKLLALFEELSIPAQVTQVGSLFNIHFTEEPVVDYASAQRGQRELLRNLYMAALNRGAVFTGRGMGCLSTPMTETELDAFVLAIRQGLQDLGPEAAGSGDPGRA